MRVFVNYRSSDEPFAAQLIDEKLCERFGRDSVFRDNRAIPLGRDFRPELWGNLAHSEVLVVVIGRRWLAAGTENGGPRRLDDPDDYVRNEIALGLKMGIPVIPVLIGDADGPRRTELPAEIADLADRQYIRVNTRAGHVDVARLVDEIDKMTGGSPAGSNETSRRAGAARAQEDRRAGTYALIRHNGTQPTAMQREQLRRVAEQAAEEARLTGAEWVERVNELGVFIPATIPAGRIAFRFVWSLSQQLAGQFLPRILIGVCEGVAGAADGPDVEDRAAALLFVPAVAAVWEKASRARVVAVLSDACFAAAKTVGADPAGYAPAVTPDGERCWIHASGYGYPPGVPEVDRPDESRPASSPAAPATVQADRGGIAIGQMNGDFVQGDKIGGSKFVFGDGAGR